MLIIRSDCSCGYFLSHSKVVFSKLPEN
jgi:hypothetical protein